MVEEYSLCCSFQCALRLFNRLENRLAFISVCMKGWGRLVDLN
jgi:hypothetical protein